MVSRRRFLQGGIAAAIGASLTNSNSFAFPHTSSPLLGFKSVPIATEDSVTVAPGYSAKVLIAWGDPVSNGPKFKHDATNTIDEQLQQWGMHNDGLAYFPIDGS